MINVTLNNRFMDLIPSLVDGILSYLLIYLILAHLVLKSVYGVVI